MADSVVTFTLYDSAGAPLTGATPTFQAYCNLSGTGVIAPSISHVAGGVYKFTVPEAEATSGRQWIVDGGGSASPRYHGGVTLAPNASPQEAMLFTNPSSGAPSAGSGAASVLIYRNAVTGAAVTPPSLIANVTGLVILPTGLNAGDDSIAWKVQAPTGTIPANYSGQSDAPIAGGGGGGGPAPVISNLSPTPPGPVGPTDQIGFDVTIASGTIARLTFGVSFTGRQGRDWVYDGDQWDPNYSGTITPIAGGFRVRFQRAGGFPGAPELEVVAVSDGGQVNI